MRRSPDTGKQRRKDIAAVITTAISTASREKNRLFSHRSKRQEERIREPVLRSFRLQGVSASVLFISKRERMSHPMFTSVSRLSGSDRPHGREWPKFLSMPILSGEKLPAPGATLCTKKIVAPRKIIKMAFKVSFPDRMVLFRRIS